MDVKQYMIVDLDRQGDKRMFVTEQVSSIRENKNGLWSVQFSSSTRVFNYNRHRLLFLTQPDTIDLGEKGLYIKNRHITNANELLRFTDGRHTFYHVSYNNGYFENFEGKDIYVHVLRLTNPVALHGTIYRSWPQKPDCRQKRQKISCPNNMNWLM